MRLVSIIHPSTFMLNLNLAAEISQVENTKKNEASNKT